MSDVVKVALIAAVTVLASVGLSIYFSSYHSCMRDGDFNAAVCAHGFSHGS
jgi:hypothetical protein